ncbi:glucose 1-dehydrogenase [Gymnodinialimonas sp. 57CJ19]|uniref:SDR family NAD(P)-dependent oxidoreductase n=1 Tax=Gymnodinialimonas sp. 57CJ19 TaxID=3138498 RepID=UPI0031344CE2
MDFNGQTVLVTGSASGIGRAIAQRFAKAGANVVLHGMGEAAKTAELAVEMQAAGVQVLEVDGDLTDPAIPKAIIERILGRFGKLDVLVNCAGASPLKNKLEDVPFDDWNRVMAININTQMLMCQAALPLLRKGQGRAIVNISSSVTRVGGVPGGIAYTSAKGAVDSFTRALARELAPEGIRVNAVAPGLVDSDFHAVSAAEHYGSVADVTPLGRLGLPSDLAGPVVFLASAEAAWVTGEVLEVTGGLRLSY